MDPEIELAQKLVSLSKPGNIKNDEPTAEDTADALNFIIKELRLREYSVQKVGEGTGTAIVARGTSDSVVFEGHIDTVPYSAELDDCGKSIGWNYKPTGEIVLDKESGKLRLYGRGATDMKSSLAAVLTALDCTSIKPLVIITQDEESGNFRGIRTALDYLRAKNITPHGGICMEPSNFEIVNARKGVITATFHTFGAADHGSKKRDEKNDAIYKMTDCLNALIRYETTLPLGDALFGGSTMNLGKIIGGSAMNVVASQCKIDLEMRLTRSHDCETAAADVASAIASALQAHKAPCDISSLNFKYKHNSYELPENHSFVTAVLQILNKEAPICRPSFNESPIMYAAGIPTITYGPSTATMHKDDEFIEVEEITKLKNTYALLINKLA